MISPTERFSNRVADYVRYRPGYPAEIIPFLEQNIGLKQNHIIADIGCGTGKSAEPFLKYGNAVFGVEPNEPMRNAASIVLKDFPKFSLINGTAENTRLALQSVDHIVAGQAFHWFDKEKCKIEFRRILRTGGFVVLIWNDRDTTATPFLHEYESLIKRYATDYETVNHQNLAEKDFDAFFGKKLWRETAFPYEQAVDFAGLKGRLTSSSYIPTADSPVYPDMIDALQAVFEKHQARGRVKITYHTRLYFGRMDFILNR